MPLLFVLKWFDPILSHPIAKPQVCNFIKKETLEQVFSCEFCGIYKNTFFAERLWANGSIFCCNFTHLKSREISCKMWKACKYLSYCTWRCVINYYFFTVISWLAKISACHTILDSELVKWIQHWLDFVTVWVFEIRFGDTYFFPSRFPSILLN